MAKPGSIPRHYCEFPGCDYTCGGPKGMKRHERIHSIDPEIWRPYKCNNCSHRAVSSQNLKIHILMKHSEGAPTYKCFAPGCAYETKVRKYLQRHQVNCHTQTPLIRCTFDGCEYQAKFKESVRKHVLTCHNQNANPPKNIQCPMCSKMFCHTYTLRLHLKAHMKERPWQCSLCSYESKKKELLLHHRESAHGEIVKAVNEGRHQCKLCDFSTSFLVRFNYHVRHHHSEERPYACSFPHCSSKFKRNGDLKIHQTLHVPERHPCPQPNCSYVAKNKHLLGAHLKKHKFPFPCVFPSCNRKFRTEAGLISHQKLHDPSRPFQCYHCPLRFKSKGEVGLHVKGLHKGHIRKVRVGNASNRRTVHFKNHSKLIDPGEAKVSGHLQPTQVQGNDCSASKMAFNEKHASCEHPVNTAVAIVLIPRLKVCFY